MVGHGSCVDLSCQFVAFVVKCVVESVPSFTVTQLRVSLVVMDDCGFACGLLRPPFG